MSKKPAANIPRDFLAPNPLKRPPELSGGATEELSLRAAVGAMNDPRLINSDMTPAEREANKRILAGAGQAIPEGGNVEYKTKAPAVPPTPPIKSTQQLEAGYKQLLAEKLPEKIFFTGRLAVGKDYCATAAGYPIFGFADPIYALANFFFGTSVNAAGGKDDPGMREFLQTVGQWGRGEVNDKYPYGPTRAIFGVMLRSLAAANALPAGVNWEAFGKSPDFWIESLLARTAETTRAAITNCRFSNEFTRLKAAGFTHFHVICSPSTWAKRLAAKRLTVDAAAVKDISEQLAKQLDAQVVKTLSEQRVGSKLRVIWNDTVPSPSARLYTLDEFLSSVKPPTTTTESSLIV